MKFECIVDIRCPKNLVAETFANPDLLHHFQDGFISKTLMKGTEGEAGAISLMKYEKLELQERIIENDLPDSFFAEYTHKYTENTMKVEFTELEPNLTRYYSEIHYFKLKGFFIKMMAFLFPGMFKKQVLKWMNQFKVYCENLN